MEPGEPARSSSSASGLTSAAAQPGAERGVVGEPPHLHRPLDDLAGALDADRLPLPGHGDDAEVDVGRQAAVEAHLLLAAVPTPLEGAVVDEAEVDRLLDLVGQRAGQEDGRDVRLVHLDGIHAPP